MLQVGYLWWHMSRLLGLGTLRPVVDFNFAQQWRTGAVLRSSGIPAVAQAHLDGISSSVSVRRRHRPPHSFLIRSVRWCGGARPDHRKSYQGTFNKVKNDSGESKQAHPCCDLVMISVIPALFQLRSFFPGLILKIRSRRPQEELGGM